MKKYGIFALSEVPDSSKPRRIFSFLDTLGNDKELLLRKIEEVLKEYQPVEVHVPNYVKKTQEFFDRWDMDMFYQEIRKFQTTAVREKEGDTENTIQRNDFSSYVGDIDTFIPCRGNLLFIDEKSTVQALKENQTAHYVALAEQTNQNVWYIVGPTPDMKNPKHKEVEYSLCEIKPNGESNWYKGSLSEVFRYLHHWLEQAYDTPVVDELETRRKARKILSDARVTTNYQPLSNKISYLEHHSKYRAA